MCRVRSEDSFQEVSSLLPWNFFDLTQVVWGAEQEPLITELSHWLQSEFFNNKFKYKFQNNSLKREFEISSALLNFH